jgi:Secretion system C-terminal sorting domain
MKNKILLFVFSIALLSNQNSKANTYIVTSNANGTTTDGVSLRWAITQANANPGPDTIVFNISGRAPQTIALTAALPPLRTANGVGTVIDGTTQPANGFTGVSPKIIIDGGGTVNNGFSIEDSNCAIYGLVITNMSSAGTGISIIANGANFIIGGAGKGNVINNIPGLGGSGISISGVNGGTIQGNKIGTDTTGLVASSVYTGISTDATTKNILIGGTGAGQGNLISGQLGGNSANLMLEGSTHITIQGNIIGPDVNGNFLHGSTISDGIYLLGADTCIIGGSAPGAGNIIGYNIDTTDNIGAGIQNQGTHADLISRNSIYCNGSWGGLQSIAGNNDYPVPVITSAYINIVSGTSSPEAIIELFYNQSGCTQTTNGCYGETYIATVNADISGNWSYSGALIGGSQITGTATDSANNTSAFANCFPVAVTTNVSQLSNSDFQFSVYPNPVLTSAVLQVDDNLLSQGCEFRLYDVFGREDMRIIINQNKTIINKTNLANGVYFYQLISNGTIAGEGKLVVE